MKRKFQYQWGVVVGKPKPASRHDRPFDYIGRWVIGVGGGPLSFNTRREARAHAKQLSSVNTWWNFHSKLIAKKVITKRKQQR
jgi:hypothetical protein